jgi:hypothetical protein
MGKTTNPTNATNPHRKQGSYSNKVGPKKTKRSIRVPAGSGAVLGLMSMRSIDPSGAGGAGAGAGGAGGAAAALRAQLAAIRPSAFFKTRSHRHNGADSANANSANANSANANSANTSNASSVSTSGTIRSVNLDVPNFNIKELRREGNVQISTIGKALGEAGYLPAKKKRTRRCRRT